MATLRVQVNVSGPITQFNTYADLVSQDQGGNFSTVYYWVQAINTGDTSSYEGNSGSQTAGVAGAGGGGHSGTLPSGTAHNAQRWYDGPWGVNLGHDGAGNRGADSVFQTLSWSGWLSRTDYGSIGPYPRIPKRPSSPGTPTASNVMPTSMTISWAASGDNAGSAIDGYLLRRWLGSSMTGTYTDISQLNNLSRTDTGLIPGTTYTYAVYAHNGSADNGGYSNVSGSLTVKTIAPVHVKVSGVWKYAVPYVKVGGIWKMAQPYVKVSGVWKMTG